MDEKRLIDLGNEFLAFFTKNKMSWLEIHISCSSFMNIMLKNQIDRIRKTNPEAQIIKELEDLTNLSNQLNIEITKNHYLCNSILGESREIGYNPTLFVSQPLKKRFEILKKHGFSCVYCGRRPPEVNKRRAGNPTLFKGGMRASK